MDLAGERGGVKKGEKKKISVETKGKEIFVVDEKNKMRAVGIFIFFGTNFPVHQEKQ